MGLGSSGLRDNLPPLVKVLKDSVKGNIARQEDGQAVDPWKAVVSE